MANRSSSKYILDDGWQALAKALGIPTQDVLRHAQLPLDLLHQTTPAVTEEEYYRLWEGLAHVLANEPTFPLRIVEAYTPELFSPPLFSCLCSDNLNMALERIAIYKPLVGPMRLALEQTEAYTTVKFMGLTPHAPPSFIAFELAFWVQIARTATREHIQPQAVYVNVALADFEAYEAYFGTHVRRADFNGLTFAAADAQQPFLMPNKSLWAIFEPELQRRMEDLSHTASFSDRVRACLNEILAGGQVSTAAVAAKLAVSSRTLQRRLRQENTTFQKILDELRKDLAYHYLTTSTYTTDQIAFLLGYRETSSFFRAFRTWTGQTPEGVRSAYAQSI